MIFGNVNDMDLEIKELKVFKGNYEVKSEEAEYMAKLNTFKNLIKFNPLSALLSKFPMLPRGLPLSPFPKI